MFINVQLLVHNVSLSYQKNLSSCNSPSTLVCKYPYDVVFRDQTWFHQADVDFQSRPVSCLSVGKLGGVTAIYQSTWRDITEGLNIRCCEISLISLYSVVFFKWHSVIVLWKAHIGKFLLKRKFVQRDFVTLREISVLCTPAYISVRKRIVS